MGIYDRDYQRADAYDDSPGFHLGANSWSWTTKLVVVMFVVYGIQLITAPAQPGPGGNEGWFTDLFQLHANVFQQPWRVFEFLTYGFLHDVGDLKHILFNMFGLWMFGRIVEGKYGPHEYLAFFLTAVVFAGVCWVISELVIGQQQLAGAGLLGASGGIAAVLILFCLNFPHQQILLWFVLPLPAWVLAIVFIGGDMLGASGRLGDHIAYTAHLGGAAFAAIYYFSGIRFTNWLGTNWRMPKLRRRPALRVLDPAEEDDDSTEEMVDNILRKIREHGQDSLTRGERRILEEASREYQKKRQ